MYKRRQLDEVFWSLNDDQREVLAKYVKHRTIKNWNDIVPVNSSDWILMDYFDCGGLYGECTCGQRIRYCYVVQSKTTNEKLVLGSTCITNYTDITDDIVECVSEGIEEITLEKDYVLSILKDKTFKTWYKENYDLIDKFVKVKGDDEYLSRSSEIRIKRFLRVRLPFLKIDEINILNAYKKMNNDSSYVEEKEFLKEALEIDPSNEFYSSIYELLQNGNDLSDYQMLALRKVMNDGLDAIITRVKQKTDLIERLDKLCECKLGHTQKFIDDLYSNLLKYGKLTNGQIDALQKIEKRFARQLTYRTVIKTRNILSNYSISFLDGKLEMDKTRFDNLKSAIVSKLVDKGFDLRSITYALDCEMYNIEKYFPDTVVRPSDIVETLWDFFQCDKRNGKFTDTYFEIDKDDYYTPIYSDFIKGYELEVKGELFYLEVFTDYKPGTTRVYISKFDDNEILRVEKSFLICINGGTSSTIRIIDTYVEKYFKELL